jgi:hypothetical protein
MKTPFSPDVQFYLQHGRWPVNPNALYVMQLLAAFEANYAGGGRDPFFSAKSSSTTAFINPTSSLSSAISSMMQHLSSAHGTSHKPTPILVGLRTGMPKSSSQLAGSESILVSDQHRTTHQHHPTSPARRNHSSS